jgi:hypothetical protein
MTTRRLTAALTAIATGWVMAFACAIAQAQDNMEPVEEMEGVEEQAPAPATDGKPFEMKATDIGVRFTPRMAQAVGSLFAREMKGQYELSDEQVNDVRQIISTRLMKTVSDNAVTGRDMIEMMMETVMENDGRFPKESAQQFATLAKPLIPAIHDLFRNTAGEIGKKMTVKQRLKFTADMAAATAGLAVFENRMKRWEEGKVGDGANPFWDPADNDPSKAEAANEDPNEKAEHRRARQRAERQMNWRLNCEEQWAGYIKKAAEFYDFDEAQNTSAKAILTDMTERAKAIMTPQWQESVRQNRIAQSLTWETPGSFSQGPWMFRLESQYEQLTKPLDDLTSELKRRIEGLPTSAQRAKAQEKIRQALTEKGLDKLPV